jgi:calmodulin
MSDDAKALGEEKVAKFKDAFSLFDKKRNGQISTKDLGTLMRAMGSNPNNGEISDLINEVDAAGSGFITFPEFLTCMRREFRPPHTEADVLKAFEVLDKAGSGSIAIDDLAKSLTDLGEPFSEEELAEFRKLAGGSGDVNYAEFVKKVMANK